MSASSRTRLTALGVAAVVMPWCGCARDRSFAPSSTLHVRRGTLALAFEATCAVTAAREVTCWGWNTNGELGLGTVDDSRHAAAVVAGLRDVVSVAARGSDVCALDSHGVVT